MFRYIIRIVVICAVLTFSHSPVVNASAQDAESVSKDPSAKLKATKIPFRGKLHSFDKESMSITLLGKTKNRTLRLIDTAKVVKGGKDSSLDEAVVGEDVGGQIIRYPDGREEVVSLRLGPKPEEEKKPVRSSKKQKADSESDQ